MTDPTVSVVIVAWKAREDTLRCLASLREHAGVPYEAIVVDDGSEDGTPEAVRAAFPEATVLARRPNAGLVAGRNAALPHVRGAYVLMLDADTEVRPGAIPMLLGALERDDRIGLVAPRLVHPDGTLQLSCRRFPPFLIPLMRRGPYARLHDDPPLHRWHMMKDYDHRTERPVAWVIGAAQMWRADLRARLGPYDRLVSSYGGEDLDWCLRVWDAGLEVRYVPDAEVMHVFQQATRRAPFGRKSLRALRDWYYLQWKHRSLRRDRRLLQANA